MFSRQLCVDAGVGDCHQGLPNDGQGCCWGGEGTPQAAAPGGSAEHVAACAALGVRCPGQPLHYMVLVDLICLIVKFPISS